MLYGLHLYDRVEHLNKAILDRDEKFYIMILSVGREYLRRVHQYLENTTDFRISSELCRDSEHINSSKRWEIRFCPEKPRRDDQLSIDNQSATDQKQNDPIISSGFVHDNATNAQVDTNRNDDFEMKRKDHYKSLGDNFACLLMKRYRQEKLEKEEIDYLDRWSSDESMHWGVMSIYCHHGQKVDELIKRISSWIDEKNIII